MTPFVSSTLFYIFTLIFYALLALTSFEYYAVKYKVSENELNQFMSNIGIPFKWLFIKNHLIMRILLFGMSSKSPIEEFQKHTLGEILYTKIIAAIFCLL